MQFLAISGSLRAQSSNTHLLMALRALQPSVASITLFEGLADLPFYNPDMQEVAPVNAVQRMRSLVRECDAVIFSTPEYAHGIPGVLKNALDWLVSSGELSGKPAVLLNASDRGVIAQASLREVLATMNARIVTGAERTVPLLGKTLDPSEIALQFGPQLQEFLTVLRRAVS